MSDAADQNVTAGDPASRGSSIDPGRAAGDWMPEMRVSAGRVAAESPAPGSQGSRTPVVTSIEDDDAPPSEEYLRGARALLTGLIWGERDA